MSSIPFPRTRKKTNVVCMKSYFLCNVSFYIGLNAEEMEAVLRNEGYTIQCSDRPDDHILFECFYYSFIRNYASALLKKDGWDGLEICK